MFGKEKSDSQLSKFELERALLSSNTVLWKYQFKTQSFCFQPGIGHLIGRPDLASELSQDELIELLHSDQKKEFKKFLKEQSLSGAQYIEHEFIFEAVNSPLLNLQWSGHVSLDESLRPILISGSVSLKTPVLEERKERHQYETALNNHSDCILFLDKKFNISFANIACLKFMKQEEQEILNHSMHELFMADDFDRILYPHIFQTLSGKAASFDHWISFASGEKSYIRFYCSPYLDNQAKVQGIITHFRDITYEKKIEDDLRVSKEELQWIADYAFDWELWCDPQGNILWSNRAIKLLTGMSVDQCLEKGGFPDALACKADLPALARVFSNDLNNQRERNGYAFRYIDLQERVYWGEGSWMPMFNRNQEFVGMRINVRDITERKKAEAHLKVQHDLGMALAAVSDLRQALRILIEHSLKLDGIDSGGIYLLDDQNTKLELIYHMGISDQFADTHGVYPIDNLYARKLMVGIPLFLSASQQTHDLLTPSWMTRESILAHAAIPIMHEGKFIASLNISSYSLYQIPERLRHTLESIAAQAGSIISRIKSQTALKESYKNFRRLFDTVSDFVLIFDFNGKILFFNEAVQQALKYTTEQLLKMSIFDIHQESDGSSIKTVIDNMISESSVLCTFPLKDKQGDTISVESKVIGGHWYQKDVMYCFSRDMTERVENEKRHRQLQEQFLQIQKLDSLCTMAGGIAHDFNNLLMGILGNTELSLLKINKDHPCVENLYEIEMASKRAAELSKKMLAFAGNGLMEMNEVNLSECIIDMQSEIEKLAPEHIRISYNLGSNLPDIHVDRSQIQQVVFSLVQNAVESIDSDSGEIQISTYLLKATPEYLEQTYINDGLSGGHYVYLDVRDNGTGMDGQTLDRIFDPFFSTKFTGRGLGLPAVLGIVRSHRGAIKVDSVLEKGTSVLMLIPAFLSPLQKKNKVSRVFQPSSRKYRILVVDDEEMLLTLTSKMLRACGYDVITASSGYEAIDIFSSSSTDIHCVLLDLSMPDMNGIEAMDAIHNINPKIPIILCTGYDRSSIASKFSHKAISGILQKPFQLVNLKLILEQCLS